MRSKKKPNFINYASLQELAKDKDLARKSLELKLPLAMPFDADFETYAWKVFFNTPRKKQLVFSE